MAERVALCSGPGAAARQAATRTRATLPIAFLAGVEWSCLSSRLRRRELLFSLVSPVGGYLARWMAGRTCPLRQLEPRAGFGCV